MPTEVGKKARYKFKGFAKFLLWIIYTSECLLL